MRENYTVDQRFIKFRPCSTQPAFLSKNGGHVRPFCGSGENSNLFTAKRLWLMLLFSQVAGLESIRAIWLKKESTAEVFEISEIFLRDIFAKDFLKKLKIYRINFYSKGGLHYLKGNLYIRMPMPMLIPMPIPMPMPMLTCWFS